MLVSKDMLSKRGVLLIAFFIRCLNGEERCLEPSVMVGNVRGRLGNHIWGYMKALAIGTKYGIAPAFTHNSIRILQPFFPSLELRPASEEFYSFYNQFRSLIDSKLLEHYRRQSGNSSLVLDFDSETDVWRVPKEYSHFEHLNVFKLTETPGFREELRENSQGNKWEIFGEEWSVLGGEEWKTGRFIFIPSGQRGGRISDMFVEPGFEDRLVKNLVLNEEYLQIANEKLLDVSNKLGTKKKIIYVGIHSRRSDHIAYETKMGLKPLKNDYYKKAIRLFRQRFEKRKKKVVLAFVFVSDDMDYGRKYMLPKEKNVFFLGTGNGNSTAGIGTDLGLLASCNHTILSYGSFSFFAGFLSGGVKIIPEHFGEYRTGENKLLTSLDDNPFDKPLPRLYFFDQLK